MSETHPEKDLNDVIRYTMWSAFKLVKPLPQDPETKNEIALDALEKIGGGTGGVQTPLTTRGYYDLSGLRAEADLLVWWHGETIEAVQDAYQNLRNSELGGHLEPFWSNVGLHRPAEFNRGHIPAFLNDETPREYICVYPFVRSYDWYVLESKERARMLREHGLAARDYPDVRANTVAAFALGDYEWLLAFEADELHRIVDLMRELRATDARLHVREEVPFFTGKRRSLLDWVARH